MSDRRTFLLQMGAVTASVAAAALAPTSASTAAAASGSASVALPNATVPADGRGVASVVPVVGFFLDQPYLDYTGKATPYVPPAGLRSAQPLAKTVDAAFHQGIGFQQDQS